MASESYDVVIVGAGHAGCEAAGAAAAMGVPTCLCNDPSRNNRPDVL